MDNRSRSNIKLRYKSNFSANETTNQDLNRIDKLKQSIKNTMSAYFKNLPVILKFKNSSNIPSPLSIIKRKLPHSLSIRNSKNHIKSMETLAESHNKNTKTILRNNRYHTSLRQKNYFISQSRSKVLMRYLLKPIASISKSTLQNRKDIRILTKLNEESLSQWSRSTKEASESLQGFKEFGNNFSSQYLYKAAFNICKKPSKCCYRTGTKT